MEAWKYSLTRLVPYPYHFLTACTSDRETQLNIDYMYDLCSIISHLKSYSIHKVTNIIYIADMLIYEGVRASSIENVCNFFMPGRVALPDAVVFQKSVITLFCDDVAGEKRFVLVAWIAPCGR